LAYEKPDYESPNSDPISEVGHLLDGGNLGGERRHLRGEPPPPGEVAARGEETGSTRGSPWVNRVTILLLLFLLVLTHFDPLAEMRSGATS
jgi:hypothetical protein